MVRVFNTWRRVLSHAVAGTRRAAKLAVNDLTQIAHGSGTPLRRPGFIVLGGICLVIGAAMRYFLSVRTSTPSQAALLAAGTVLWATVRGVSLGLVSRRLRNDFPTLLSAWAIGLVPMTVAVTPWSVPVAWILSAAITRAALIRLGEPTADATRDVAVAWLTQVGLQVLVTGIGWLAMNAWVATLTSA